MAAMDVFYSGLTMVSGFTAGGIVTGSISAVLQGMYLPLDTLRGEEWASGGDVDPRQKEQ